jgi:cobalt-zinc-cadmium efflux system outer membrane protein
MRLAMNWLVGSVLVLSLAAQVPAFAQEAGSRPALRLADLERMAVETNPTLKQAEAAVRAAEGRARQAGLLPNPTIGAAVNEYSFRYPSKTAEYLGIVEQAVVIGGRLRQGRRVFEQERLRAQAEAEAQSQAVRGLTRMAYYQALGAQTLVEVRTDLARVAREAVGITGELYNVGQADRPDILEIEIEAERAELDLTAARNEQDRAWRLLTAVVGDASMAPARLDGDLEAEAPDLERDPPLANLVSASPQLRIARAEQERAQAAVDLARAQRVPDLIVRGSLGYNREVLDVIGGPKGWEGALELSIQLPIFNRNQGTIAAARAAADRAQAEVRRVELELAAQLGGALSEYRNARGAAQRYRERLVPNAQRAYDMYRSRFQEMSAAYPQVLIAQRTLFQLRAEYVTTLVELWQSVARLQGFLLTSGLQPPGQGERPEGMNPALSAGAKRSVEH